MKKGWLAWIMMAVMAVFLTACQGTPTDENHPDDQNEQAKTASGTLTQVVHETLRGSIGLYLPQDWAYQIRDIPCLPGSTRDDILTTPEMVAALYGSGLCPQRPDAGLLDEFHENRGSQWRGSAGVEALPEGGSFCMGICLREDFCKKGKLPKSGFL